MQKLITLILVSASVVTNAQSLSSTKSIDSVVIKIENDKALTKRIYDTVRYEKEDGDKNWDSLYSHIEYFFLDGQLVRIVAWNRYQNWRNDMIGYYQDGKTIKFAKGESIEGTPDYGKLDFAIYYYNDQGIEVTWITPKPKNVLGIDQNAFLKWSCNLVDEMKSHLTR